jgi:hypothetical protein
MEALQDGYRISKRDSHDLIVVGAVVVESQSRRDLRGYRRITRCLVLSVFFKFCGLCLDLGWLYRIR